MAGINFGTDGWRAVIAEDFTFANVRCVSQAIAQQLIDSGLAALSLPTSIELMEKLPHVSNILQSSEPSPQDFDAWLPIRFASKEPSELGDP